MTPQIQKRLKKNELRAIKELKHRIQEKVPGTRIILFGSKARGDFEEFSDIDLLILVDAKTTMAAEEEIRTIKFEAELKYDVVFGIIIRHKDFWDSALARAMPLHWNIDKEGVAV